jgi:hypothetical protein
VRDNLEVKEIVVGNGEARERYILVRNPEEAARDKARREKIIKELEEQLPHMKSHVKAVCELMAQPVYGRYLKLDSRSLPKIDRAKIREEEKLDGKYLLRTSDDTLSAEDVALRQVREHLPQGHIRCRSGGCFCIRMFRAAVFQT